MKKNGRNDSAHKKKAPMPTEVYTEEELDAVESHIEKHFGAYANVFHEIVSPDIHLDICIVDPTEERNYYMLVTLGMGAHRMNVPADLAEHKLERAELAIALPCDWNIHESAEEHYWPIHLLKNLARLPIENRTWLGWGHTIDARAPYAENTALSATLIVSGQVKKGGSNVCVLPDGDEVNFYQIIPLHKDELKYKLEHNADALLDRFAERHVSFVIDPERRSALAPEDFTDLVMDNAQWHLEKRVETSDEEEHPANRFISYWNYETQKTQPMILAKIPVQHPWEVFAYLPFGGWNDCPDTAALMAVSKYWHEQQGAVPAVLTYETLEYRVPAPVPQESALQLAKEQYAFCADIVEQGAPGMTVGKLAADLKNATVWYFWWD